MGRSEAELPAFCRAYQAYGIMVTMKNSLTEYAICRAEARYLPFLNDIEMAAATIFPPGFLPAHVLLDKVPIPVLREAMEQSRLWVALLGPAKPVGYALLQIVADGTLLAQMDVHPEHGRKGLGTALVKQVIEEIRAKDIPALYLTTFANVRWNAPFYAKCGFVVLPADEQSEFIKDILRVEQEHGLENRVAMRYSAQ